jgi:hypothetical protein
MKTLVRLASSSHNLIDESPASRGDTDESPDSTITPRCVSDAVPQRRP